MLKLVLPLFQVEAVTIRKIMSRMIEPEFEILSLLRKIRQVHAAQPHFVHFKIYELDYHRYQTRGYSYNLLNINKISQLLFMKRSHDIVKMDKNG